MMKLVSLYNEIKLIPSQNYPKNKQWNKIVNNIEEWVLLMKVLENLNYKWDSGKKPTEVFPTYSFPIEVHHNYFGRNKGTLLWSKANENINEIKIINPNNITPQIIVDLLKTFPKVKKWQKRDIFNILEKYVSKKEGISILSPENYKYLPSNELKNLWFELSNYKQKYLDNKINEIKLLPNLKVLSPGKTKIYKNQTNRWVLDIEKVAKLFNLNYMDAYHFVTDDFNPKSGLNLIRNNKIELKPENDTKIANIFLQNKPTIKEIKIQRSPKVWDSAKDKLDINKILEGDYLILRYINDKGKESTIEGKVGDASKTFSPEMLKDQKWITIHSNPKNPNQVMSANQSHLDWYNQQSGIK